MGVQIPEAAELLLKETNTLISMPEVCLKLRDLLDDPDHSLDEVCRLIVHDPSLTTRVLKIVNSAYYGLASPVKTINHALNVLGEEELHNLVIVTAIFNTMNKIESGVDMKKFWQRSVFCAVMAENLASRSQSSVEQEEIFITGLLLNIGKLLTFHWEPELLQCVEQNMKDQGVPDFIAEKDQLGFNHSHVGALLAKRWNFSEQMACAIRDHHLSMQGQGPENPVIFTAAFISDHLGFKDKEEDMPEQSELEQHQLLASLGMDMDQFLEIYEKSYQDYQQAYEAFCGS